MSTKVSEDRWDVVYHGDHVSIEPHFCREWDENGGCYGTNPNHGLALDEAVEEVAKWHEKEAAMWRNRTHHTLEYYFEQE